MRIGLAQMNIHWENIQKNQEKVKKFFEKAEKNGVECIVFPEMTLTGFSMNVEQTGMRWKEQIDFFKKMSMRYHMMAVFGYTMPLSDALLEEHPDWNHFHNRLGVVENGQLKMSYAKIHPFMHGIEGKYYQGGESLASMNWKGTNIGAFVCYDLRFPEIFQISSRECEIIFVIANWPNQRIDQWDILLRARAVENQVFMVGVNRTGEGDGLHYNGHSVIYGPRGERITAEKEGECLIIGDIDPSEVGKSRKNFPAKEDRRESLYVKLWKNAGF